MICPSTLSFFTDRFTLLKKSSFINIVFFPATIPQVDDSFSLHSASHSCDCNRHPAEADLLVLSISYTVLGTGEQAGE